MEEVSENSFTLTWKAPEQTGRAGLDGYVVEICKDGSRFGLSCPASMERCAWLWDGLELGGIQKSITPSNDYLSLPKWIHFEWLFIFHDIPLASDSRNVFIRGLGQV